MVLASMTSWDRSFQSLMVLGRNEYCWYWRLQCGCDLSLKSKCVPSSPYGLCGRKATLNLNIALHNIIIDVFLAFVRDTPCCQYSRTSGCPIAGASARSAGTGVPEPAGGDWQVHDHRGLPHVRHDRGDGLRQRDGHVLHQHNSGHAGWRLRPHAAEERAVQQGSQAQSQEHQF